MVRTIRRKRRNNPKGCDGMDKNETNLKDYNVRINIPNLVEATVDGESRNVLVKIIESGWSKNGNYYSDSIVESFVPLLEDKKKMYINHLLKPNQADYIGRDMRDWGAQIQEAYYEDGACYAKVHVFESEQWLLERITKFPDDVGVSIDARARIREGEMEGKTGRIVEEIIKFNSSDFVLTPSAGGQTLRLVAGMPEDIDDPTIIFEAIKSMQDYVNSNYKQFSRLFEGFYNYIWYVMGNSKYDYEKGTFENEGELKDSLAKGFDDFKKAMLDLDFSKVYMFEAVQEHGKDEYDNLFEVDNNTEEGEKMDIQTLKQEHSDIVDALKEEFLQEMEKNGELDTVKAELDTVKENLKTLKEEKETLQKQVDDFTAKEAVQTKKSMVDSLLKESKLDTSNEKIVSETFREYLMSGKDEDEIKSRIQERENLVLAATGKVEDAGETNVAETETETETQETVNEEISDEKALEILRN